MVLALFTRASIANVGRSLRIAATIAAGLSLVACGPAPQPSPSTAPTPTQASPTAAPRLGAFPPLRSGDLPAEVGASLQGIIDEAVKGIDVPGIAAAVIAADRGGWVGAAGSADGSSPLDPTAQFGIGSVTKTVVAAAVLRLAESGEVDLDQPLAAYLGDEVPSNGATVRQVLGMRSGIGELRVDEHACDENLAARVSTADMLGWLSEEPVFEPGSQFRYTNANYTLAGLLIEKVTGTSVARALRAGVLSSTGLERLVYQDEEAPTPPLAAPFVIRPDAAPVPEPAEMLRMGGGYLPARCLASGAGPAGGMASDAMTLARWGYLLYGGWVLGDDSLAQMARTEDGYGLAAHDHELTFGVPAIGHEGSVPGYVTSLLAFPDEGVVLAVLVNTNGASADSLIAIAGRLRAVVRQSPGEGS